MVLMGKSTCFGVFGPFKGKESGRHTSSFQCEPSIHRLSESVGCMNWFLNFSCSLDAAALVMLETGKRERDWKFGGACLE